MAEDVENRSLLSRIAWFVALWLVGVASLALVATALRALIAR
jgi:hypothetical protein